MVQPVKQIFFFFFIMHLRMHNHKNCNVTTFLVDFCKMYNHINCFNCKKGTAVYYLQMEETKFTVLFRVRRQWLRSPFVIKTNKQEVSIRPIPVNCYLTACQPFLLPTQIFNSVLIDTTFLHFLWCGLEEHSASPVEIILMGRKLTATWCSCFEI